MSSPGHKTEEIFAAALRITDATARRAHLETACAGDEPLRREIEALLRAHEEAGNFLGQTVKLRPSDIVIERTGMRIGRYKLLEQIGEGGFGVVYMAEQIEPVQRKVALKIIKAGMDTREVIARFEAERQALALMDHPNIARVLDAGATEAGRPYFVMELVRGMAITDYCDQASLPTAERLRLFLKVCHAVQHAHQKGIIHRDLKPSNVLVTLHDGEPVPKVIDFGVAKALGRKLTEKTLFTGFTQMMGTPAYMSPEQAALSGLDIDTRSDIYSLGVLLYELLTGVTPFDKETLARAALDEICRMIRETDPPRPSTRLQTLGDKLTDVAKRHQAEPPKLIHQVRGDLDWIVMKCLEKDRGRRYETASGLARDLTNHIEHQPVSAVAPTAGYRLRKLLRRHRLAAAWTASFALLLVLTAVGSTVMALYAQRQKGRAETAEGVTRDHLYAADMGLAKQALDGARPRRALELLRAHIPQPGQTDRRGVEWRYLWMQCRGAQVAVLPLVGNRSINGLCFTPDDRFLVTASDSGSLAVLRFEDFKLVCRTNAFTNAGCAVLAMSADGARLAVAGNSSGTVGIWTLSPDGSLALMREITASSPYGLAFSPDGQKLAVGTEAYSWTGDIEEGGVTRIFSVETGGALATLPESGGRAVDWSPDGRWIATGPWRGWNLKVWNAESLQLSGTIQIRTPRWARFSADGRSLLLGNLFGKAACYRLPDLRESVTLGTRSGVSSGDIFDGAFSASGRLTAICAGNRISLEDLQTRKVSELIGHGSDVRSLAFSRDGAFLVSGDDSGRLLLWGVNPQAGHTRLRTRTDEYKSLPMPPSSRNGEQMAIRAGSQVCLVNGKTGRVGPVLPTPAYPLAFPDDQTLLTIRGLSFLESHNRLLPQWKITNQPPYLEFWDLQALTNRSVELSAVGSKEISAVAVTRDGEHLALAWRHGEHTNGVVILASRSGDVRFSASGIERRIWGMGFAQDGRQLAVTTQDGKVRVYAPPAGDPLLRLKFAGDVPDCPAFSPDGRRLAVSGWKGVQVWSLPEGHELASFVGQINSVRHVGFSADGRTLIGYGWAQTKLWNLPTQRELFALRGGEPRNLIPLTGEQYASTELRMDTRSEENFWEMRELPPLNQAEEWLSAQPATLAGVRALICPTPSRDPNAPASLINLDASYAAPLDRNWHGGMPGNDLGPLPRGVQVFGAVAFDVRGLVLPDRAGIHLGQPCRRLRFLHNATGHGISPGNLVGRYVIHYADGQTAEVPLVTGRNIQDWWENPGSLAPGGGAQVAWAGKNMASEGQQRTIHLLTLTWENPRPDIPVRAVDFLQIGNIAHPFLVALTAE